MHVLFWIVVLLLLVGWATKPPSEVTPKDILQFAVTLVGAVIALLLIVLIPIGVNGLL